MSDTDATFNFLISMIYTQLFNLLCEKADDVYGGRLPVHVRCLIDEMANIGQIPNLEKLVATIRSREISACLVLQAQSQLKAIYKDNADTIIGNMDSRIFLGGSEPTTLKELNQALGKETIDTYNTSNTRGNSPSYGLNYQKLGKDLTDAYNNDASNDVKNILNMLGEAPMQYASRDGKLYGIPAALDPTEGVAGLYYRSDWLDALGLSEPTNVQEMNDMLVKFAEYGPTVNGGKATAGLGSTSSVLNTNFALAAYFQAYGAYPNKWIMRDGELVNGIVQDEMVDALNGLKDLYDRGALAPDFATWNSDQFTERVTSDQVGATFGTYYIPAWPLNQNKDANPDADWKEINLPNLGGNAKPAMNQASIQFFNVVTKNAPEHAEEALVKLINLGMAVNENCATDKTIFNGLDKAENGASVFYLPVYIYFPVPWATYRPEIWAAYEAKDRDSLKVEYEKVMYDYMDDWLTNGNNSENRGTSWGQYKSRLEKGMGIDIGLTARETGFYETNYFYGGATATEQRASSTLSDTATSFIIEYIMGQKTEADWESFKQSWNDMGGADWTKEVNEQYKSIAG